MRIFNVATELAICVIEQTQLFQCDVSDTTDIPK